jgi:hypothetical protein
VSLTVQTIRIANRDDDHGALVFTGEFLIAVLSRLSSEHGDHAGWWYLECSFGPAVDHRDSFPSLEEACAWIEERISRDKPGTD